MPSNWEPWPGKTNTVLPAGWSRHREPPSHPGHRRPIHPVRPTTISRSAPTTTARCSNAIRPANDHPTSATCEPRRGHAHVRPAERPAPLPPTPTSRHHPRHHRSVGPASRDSSTAAADSTITCALVPLIPNEDTPARRGLARTRPGPRLGQQRHRPRRPIHMRARHIHVQRRRQHLVAHRLHHLDHTRHPGGGLRVTHIRLDRPQPQRLPQFPRGIARKSPTTPGLQSDRPTWCRSRGPRPHPPQPLSTPHWPAPPAPPAAARAHWARSTHWTRRPD